MDLINEEVFIKDEFLEIDDLEYDLELNDSISPNKDINIEEENNSIELDEETVDFIKVESSIEIVNIETIVPKRRSKRTNCYSEEFREEVLKFYEEKGIYKTCEKYDINNSLIYAWKKYGIKPKKKTYNTESKEKALMLAKAAGISAAAKESKIPKRYLYKWLEESPVLLQELRSRRSFSEAFKQEVVDYWQLHGSTETMTKYGNQGLNTTNLSRWVKAFAVPVLSPFTGEMVKGLNEQKGYQWTRKLEIIEYANQFGNRIAASKFNVETWKIMDWKQKLRRKQSKTLRTNSKPDENSCLV